MNCQTELDGPFCSQCGQKRSTGRLTLINVVHDFMEAVSDSQRGLPRTLIDLSKDPGGMIRDYLAGKRQRYLSAGKYTLLFIVLFTVAISLIEAKFGLFEALVKAEIVQQSLDQKKGVAQKEKAKTVKQDLATQDTKTSAKDEDDLNLNFDLWDLKIRKKVTSAELLDFFRSMVPRYHRLLFDYLKFFLVLWIPIFALFSYLFFWKQKLTFAEHITLNSYIYAHQLFLFLCFTPLIWLLPNANGLTFSLAFLTMIFYLFFSYMSVFVKAKSRAVLTLFSTGAAMTTYLFVLSFLLLGQAVALVLYNIDKLPD